MRLHWSKARASVMGNKGVPLIGEPLPEQQQKQQPTEASNKVELESQ